MTTPIVTDNDPHRICRMSCEHAHLELLETQDRVSELLVENAMLKAEAADARMDLEYVRATLHSCIDGLRAVTTDRNDLRQQIDLWILERRQDTSKPRWPA